MTINRLMTLFLASAWVCDPASAATPTYKDVAPILTKHCAACHDAKEADGHFVIDTHALLMKGGESGPAILPGKSADSPLVKQLEHREKPFMPPPKKAAKLSDAEIALIRAWIDAGANNPDAGDAVAAAPRTLPHVKPAAAPRRAVHAMAYDPKAKLLAVAVLNEVELRDVATQSTVAKLGPHKGHVNAVAFSADGKRLFAAAGEPGVAAEVTVWNVRSDHTPTPAGSDSNAGNASRPLARFEGHKDAAYAIAVSPDGKTLATGSYDQHVILWDASTGKPLRTLDGHNGAVFDVAFRPDGKVLATASADRTVKLWDVATGKRLDTRAEPTKEQQSLAFSPDGARLYAGGADNRVRVWQVSPTALEGTNALLASQFAHEGAILRLSLSPDGKQLLTSAEDKTVKLWDADKVELTRALEPQSDWPSAVAFARDSKTLVVGRLDGTVGYYTAADGKKVAPPKPEVAEVAPRGVQRGTTAKVKLTGKDIVVTTGVTVSGTDKLKAKFLGVDRSTPPAAWFELTAAADAPLGAFDLVATSPGGNSAATKVIVDDLPQLEELAPAKSEPTPTPAGSDSPAHAATLPVTLGGHFATRGDADAFTFDGTKGQSIVIDAAAKRFASKADPIVALLDPVGRPIASAGDDFGDADPLLVATLPADGRYTVRINDLQGATSAAHYYRASIGAFPYVTGTFPLAVPPSADATVNLVGYNLPGNARVAVKAPASGEVTLQLPPGYRSRRPIVVSVGGDAEGAESEPNDTPARANTITLANGVSARFDDKQQGGDVDLYRFTAKAGQPLIVETQAAQRFSAADTKIEILWPDGRPVERLQLRAVRDSWINFRPIDAAGKGARLEFWEEMELNQYLYMQGEVVKLFLYPRGPDSEFDFYQVTGRRRSYFDTSPTAHALEEKVYVVEPHAPGETLAPNGLPVFKLNYANDDDAMRQIGSDSRLSFTPPADGDYLVRVTDTRNFAGPRFTYRLLVRPAKPEFTATIEGVNPVVPPGSGRNFTVRVNRIDGFDGDVRVDVAAPYPFVVSNPVVVQAGHLEAQGTVYLPAVWPTTRPIAPDSLKATASAEISGLKVAKPLPPGPKLAVGDRPMMTVTLAPIDPAAAMIAVRPGERVPATLRVKRGTFKGPVSFEVENLPHGVIVADIGLNGVLIPEGQEERQIFLKCALWVQPQTRPCHARAREGDNPTSPPVVLTVSGPSTEPTAQVSKP